MPEEFEDDHSGEYEQPPAFFPRESMDSDGTEHEFVAVQIEGLFSLQDSHEPVVLLTDGTRQLPIVIGGFEAGAISKTLEGQQYDRPLTHDLMRALMDRSGLSLESVLIDDIWNDTYYAKMIVRGPGGSTIELDARPSDALAMAVRFECPIFVSEKILDR